jgi:hypothetical protein
MGPLKVERVKDVDDELVGVRLDVLDAAQAGDR